MSTFLGGGRSDKGQRHFEEVHIDIVSVKMISLKLTELTNPQINKFRRKHEFCACLVSIPECFCNQQ